MSEVKMMFSNETMVKANVLHQDRIIFYAGHILIGFYCLIFLLGFLGNLAVIYVGIRKKKYRNVTNCFVINLACADLCFISLSIPYTTYLGLVDILPFSEKLCKIYMLLTYVFLLVTCNTLAAMSVDRYFYIVLPRSKLLWRTSRNALLICTMIWISSFILIIPYYIFRANRHTCDLNDDRNFLICSLIFSIYYAIPLLVIIICYTKLAKHVIESNRLLIKQIVTVKREREKNIQFFFLFLINVYTYFFLLFSLEKYDIWLGKKAKTCNKNGIHCDTGICNLLAANPYS